jgi:hypothetical protein
MKSDIHTSVDHIVFISPSLEAGADYIYEILGIMPQKGGSHIKMGTHNALLRLGASTYLEVIAINPDLPGPGRPRWFGLDKLKGKAKPLLLTWVARTDNIQLATKNFQTLFGNAEQMNRGALSWFITIPPDGSLPFDGVCPSLIQWLNEPHPAAKLPDSGCSLVEITGYHHDANRINKMLDQIGFKGTFSVKTIRRSLKPYLVVNIRTPEGIHTFRSF